MEDRIARYLSHRMPQARDVAVHDLARIAGGSSQETFRFRAVWREGVETVERALILRRAPVAGTVVVQQDLEFNVYAALAGRGVPVPHAHFLELDPQWLDRSFFIMDLCPGKPGSFSDADPYPGIDAEIARQFWRHLGTLAAIDHRAIGLDHLRNGAATGRFWARELDHWEAILDEGELYVEPIVRGAIRWMRANPPPEPRKPAITHGDYRSGNFLFMPDGRISAILDWEMCHISDPLEDIAWALDPLWSMARHLPEAESLAIWEEASEMTVDREALDWWRLFAPVKGCGIWTTAEASIAEGRSGEMIVLGAAVLAGRVHRNAVLTRMIERGAGR